MSSGMRDSAGGRMFSEVKGNAPSRERDISGTLRLGHPHGPIPPAGMELLVELPEGEVSLYSLLRPFLGRCVRVTLELVESDAPQS